jgi:hypothetical protein
MEMKEKKDPWTDPDPQPGDFDEYIAEMGPEDVQVVPPGTTKIVYIGNEDPDEYVRRKRAERAKREAAERGRTAAPPNRR